MAGARSPVQQPAAPARQKEPSWQSIEDSQEFYSFGPWAALDAIQGMGGHRETPKEIGGSLRRRSARNVPGSRYFVGQARAARRTELSQGLGADMARRFRWSSSAWTI